MKKFIDQILRVVPSALIAGMLFYNGSVLLIVANEECSNTAAATGACTSCDEDYAGATPDCDEDSECAGSGYSVSTSFLSTASSTGTYASYYGNVPCLWTTECKVSYQEDGTKKCYPHNNAISSGPFYYTYYCGDDSPVPLD
ncbi:MAG: hypothetical protein LBJ67_10415 [Planctomycetaceae bacterium]|jgi:hypothetical protein|nr:hypothetical protein [Planctomycetaceae bacterium]